MESLSIRVTTPDGSYPILIGRGLLTEPEGVTLAKPFLKGRVVIVSNSTLTALYQAHLTALLPDAVWVSVPDGEQYKTLDTVARLYGDFINAGLDRGGTVVALGGGVVGDSAGFAAATYLRGVRFVQAPTTLLAMVDASVGGKVGVDLPQGKNLVGAFKQPEAVLMDTHVLATLPEREWRGGLAEVIKHGLLSGDETLLNSARTLQKPGQKPGSAAAAEHDGFVQRAVQVKVDIVQQDPFEANIRAYLNLGHTFAHAVEQVSGYTWAHGEAVGVGLLAAAQLSLAQGLCEPMLVEQVRAVLLDVGLPVQLDGFDPELLYAAMGTDKKRQAGRLRFVLLRGVGQPVIADDVPKKRVLDVLDSLRGR